MCEVRSLAQIPDRPVAWLWPGWLPAGKLTLLDGDPDAGKSLLVAELAARLFATDRFGLYHLTNAGATTWHDLAAAAFALAGVTADLTPIPTSGYPTPARRPPYSVLSTAKYEALGLAAPRPWREALADYLRARTARGG